MRVTSALIADDHALFRAGLIELLRRRFAGAVGVSEAESFSEAVDALAHGRRFDLVFCDLDMPDLGRGRNLSTVVTAAQPTPVVVISASAHESSIRAALDLGAAAYLPKRDDFAVFEECLDHVLAGRVWRPPGEERVRMPSRPWEEPADGPAGAGGGHVLATLTAREQRVLAGVVQGLSNKEIARRANVSDATVKVHMRSIFEKLDVSNRTQAALWAVRRIDAPTLRELVASHEDSG